MVSKIKADNKLGNPSDKSRDTNFSQSSKLYRVTPITEEEIKEKLSNVDTSGISALLIYDPDPNYKLSFPFIAIATNMENAEKTIDKLYEWGYGGGGSYDITWYYGSNGLYGGSHHVIKDFSVKV